MTDRKRKTIEDIVPSLDLCKRIPAGAFEDSALVYCVVGDGSGGERWYLVERKNAGETKYPEIHPAPTLQEIMLALDEAGYTPGVNRLDLFDEEARKNPSIAALKLWLEKEGVE